MSGHPTLLASGSGSCVTEDEVSTLAFCELLSPAKRLGGLGQDFRHGVVTGTSPSQSTGDAIEVGSESDQGDELKARLSGGPLQELLEEMAGVGLRPTGGLGELQRPEVRHEGRSSRTRASPGVARPDEPADRASRSRVSRDVSDVVGFISEEDQYEFTISHREIVI